MDGVSNGDSVITGYAATSPHAGYDSKRNQRNLAHKQNEVQHRRNLQLNKTEELSITEEESDKPYYK